MADLSAGGYSLATIRSIRLLKKFKTALALCKRGETLDARRDKTAAGANKTRLSHESMRGARINPIRTVRPMSNSVGKSKATAYQRVSARPNTSNAVDSWTPNLKVQSFQAESVNATKNPCGFLPVTSLERMQSDQP